MLFFICGQVMAQSTTVYFNNKGIACVQTYDVTQRVDENGEIKYDFSPDLKLPIERKDTLSYMVLPDGRFTTIALFDAKGNVEFVDLETAVNYKLIMDINPVFGDGYTYGMRYNKTLKVYEYIYYDDIGIYNP